MEKTEYGEGARTAKDGASAREKRVEEALSRRGFFAEIMRKVLLYCAERRAFSDVEQEMATYPEFRYCDQSQAAIIRMLADAGGLAIIELDDAGAEVAPERKRSLSEDEVDMLVSSYAVKATEAGLAVARRHAPEDRLRELFDGAPERADAYRELLEMCLAPQSYEDVARALQGKPPLSSENDLSSLPAYPSALLAKLEAAGGLVWDEAWKTTEAGKASLCACRVRKGE